MGCVRNHSLLTTPYSLYREFDIVDYIVSSPETHFGHYSAAQLITSLPSHRALLLTVRYVCCLLLELPQCIMGYIAWVVTIGCTLLFALHCGIL